MPEHRFGGLCGCGRPSGHAPPCGFPDWGKVWTGETLPPPELLALVPDEGPKLVGFPGPAMTVEDIYRARVASLETRLTKFRHLAETVIKQMGGVELLYDHEDNPTGDDMCASCGQSAVTGEAIEHDEDCLSAMARAALEPSLEPDAIAVPKDKDEEHPW